MNTTPGLTASMLPTRPLREMCGLFRKILAAVFAKFCQTTKTPNQAQDHLSIVNIVNKNFEHSLKIKLISKCLNDEVIYNKDFLKDILVIL